MSDSPAEQPSATSVFGPVSAGSMKVVAALLGDPNEIHFDRESVRRVGLGDLLVNQGPATAAAVYEAIATAHPGHRLASVRLRYHASVVEGDQLEVLLLHLVSADQEQAGQVSLDIQVRSQTGTTIITGAARLARR